MIFRFSLNNCKPEIIAKRTIVQMSVAGAITERAPAGNC